MSIASLGTIQVPQTFAAGTVTAASKTPLGAAATSASQAQGAFGAQLQSLMGGQSSATSGAVTAAHQAHPARGTPGRAYHHRSHHASSTDANVADDTARAGTWTGAAGGTGQQAPGRVLLNDMMRGLQAYGATTTLM
jgi:hypothetical protein